MAQSVIPTDLLVTGHGAFNTLSVASATITNAMISASTEIDSTKVEHYTLETFELFGPTTSVAALTQWIATMRAAGTIVSFEAAIAVVATGADRTITVDLQKSTGAGAFSTVCSATIGFTNASAVRTLGTATLSATSLVDGDILEVVVTVAGAAGAQATGLTVSLGLDRTRA